MNNSQGPSNEPAPYFEPSEVDDPALVVLKFSYISVMTGNWSTQTQQMSIISSFNANQSCQGNMFIPESAIELFNHTGVPLVNCDDRGSTEISAAVLSGRTFPCLFLYSASQKGCQINDVSGTLMPNVFTLLNGGTIADFLLAEQNDPRLYVTRVYLPDSERSDVFRTTLVAVVVTLAVVAAVSFGFFCYKMRQCRFTRSRNANLPTVRRTRRKLNEGVVKTFETFTFDGNNNDTQSIRSSRTQHTAHGETVETAESCTICLEEYELGDLLRRLPCGHIFHARCIDHWLTTRSTSCPLCREDFDPSKDEANNHSEEAPAQRRWVAWLQRGWGRTRFATNSHSVV